jgi:ribosomal-protein-alanine N-acetyltransferase
MAAIINLREHAGSDLDQLIRLANNERVSRYLRDTFPHPYTRADGEWWLRSGSTENGAITRVIEYQGHFVGCIGIKPQRGWRAHLAEIGYWVGEEYWGRGIGAAALSQMTIEGFALSFRKLYAPVMAPNIASMRILAKCGYGCEAVMKDEVMKHGLPHDIHQFARLRSPTVDPDRGG